MPGLNDLWAKAKQHPYYAAAVLFIVGAILIYFTRSPAATPARAGASSGAGAATGANTFLATQALQQQYAAQLAGQQTAQAVASDRVNAALSLADKSVAVDTLNINAGQTLGLADIAARESIALGSIAAVVDLNKIGAAVSVNNTNQLYSFLNQQLADRFASTATPAPAPVINTGALSADLSALASGQNAISQQLTALAGQVLPTATIGLDPSVVFNGPQ